IPQKYGPAIYHIFEHWLSAGHGPSMSALLALGLSLLMICTAFLSGIFGMAGGLILIGVLLALFPVPTAMVLHAVTQMASNGWRATLWWKHIVWRSIGVYVAGCLVSVALWSL